MRLLALLQPLLAGLILSVSSGAALADDIDGTWRLVKRQLPDGTIQTPPTVVGAGTLINGVRHLNVFWHTLDGNAASIGVISKVSVTANAYTETLVALVYDDGSGKLPVYTFSGETRTAAVTREGGRISYQMPFDPPSVVYQGNELTATLEGAFVDYWERVR